MSCTPLPKAAKPVWANQLTRLPCLVVNVTFQFVYTLTFAKKMEFNQNARLRGPSARHLDQGFVASTLIA